MRVVVTPYSVAVQDAGDLSSLAVQLQGAEAHQVDALLGDAGHFDGTHAWLAADFLRAAGPEEAEWRTRFDEMVAYARSKGWTSADGRRIRAHVEAS